MTLEPMETNHATCDAVTTTCPECGGRVCASDTCPKMQREIRALIDANRQAWRDLPEETYIDVVAKFAVLAMVDRMERIGAWTP